MDWGGPTVEQGGVQLSMPDLRPPPHSSVEAEAEGGEVDQGDPLKWTESCVLQYGDR